MQMPIKRRIQSVLKIRVVWEKEGHIIKTKNKKRKKILCVYKIFLFVFFRFFSLSLSFSFFFIQYIFKKKKSIWFIPSLSKTMIKYKNKKLDIIVHFFFSFFSFYKYFSFLYSKSLFLFFFFQKKKKKKKKKKFWKINVFWWCIYK
jgi:hypothetical protein